MSTAATTVPPATARGGEPRHAPSAPTSLAGQVLLVFGRSLRRGRREPAMAFVFPVAFPLLMVGLFSQVHGRVAAVRSA